MSIIESIKVKRVDFSKVAVAKPLSWWRSNYKVWMTCSNGHPAILEHDIAVNGKVSPSVVCIEDECGFHEYVTLEGYDNEC